MSIHVITLVVEIADDALIADVVDTIENATIHTEGVLVTTIRDLEV